ncbi:hypothetical protein C7H19_04925 [Aphanothece hegewaldii CCALA 016]|uniref:PEP-CTERM sorting domain-containing protein n=1 Tax=Aphanothece hegewaldii CCALA 016 TaxID=2107694 RepID=A0A2T1M162_9CHRO|nr:PEP-CTERM sorting domain-containing protein [Aphanothece hegewaldii]PSF38339.1 hypothetical protein C7H19_04925 [Aphanothece hegewaldii CCALA 016]
MRNAKVLIFAVGTAIGWYVSTPNLAQAAIVNMNLSFINSSKEQIGKGSFSYDDEAPIEAINGEHNDIQIGIVKKWFYIKSFEATVKNMSWGLPSLGIWDSENKQTFSISYNTYGDPNIINQWIMGDHKFGSSPALIMGQQSFTVLTSKEPLGGKWVASLVDNDTPDVPSDGVPEPPTILGSLFAIGILTLFKRVMGVKKSG